MKKAQAQRICQKLQDKFPHVEFYVREFKNLTCIQTSEEYEECFVSVHEDGNFQVILSEYDAKKYKNSYLNK